jgi:hypothetical protein
MKPAELALLQQIEKKLEQQRPSPGKHIRITQGKHKGRSGVVLQHVLDQHDFTMLTSRIELNETQQVREWRGREGYQVLIKDLHTKETLWIKANDVTCI